MASIREEWLAQVVEPIEEPELEIVDPHHHLWDTPRSRYLLEELGRDLGSGHRVVQTVFVECRSMYRSEGPEALRPVGETEFVESLAREAAARPGMPEVAAGIVGLADLGLGEGVRPVLEAHLAASPERFRGIRHASAWDASPDIRNAHTDPAPGLLLQPSFQEGFRVLGELGLSFDAWLYHPQIPELTELARRHPEVPVVLDHVGGVLGLGPWAGRREAALAGWRRDIEELARCPNVHVKLGGFGMPLFGHGFHRRERPPGSDELVRCIEPFVAHCVECFGAQRCMFESNFPVDKVSVSYPVLWNAFKKVTRSCSPGERAWLFRDSARRFYRLRRSPSS